MLVDLDAPLILKQTILFIADNPIDTNIWVSRRIFAVGRDSNVVVGLVKHCSC